MNCLYVSTPSRYVNITYDAPTQTVFDVALRDDSDAGNPLDHAAALIAVTANVSDVSTSATTPAVRATVSVVLPEVEPNANQ